MSNFPKIATAAVAIIKSINPEESVLILRRVSHPKDPWSGHFSFPGGKKDDEDQDLLATCLRETKEETGLTLESSQLVRSLPLTQAGHSQKNHLLVQPFLFVVESPPPLTLSPLEIQSSCWLPITDFQNLEMHRQVEMFPGHMFPAYPLGDYYLWGFTYGLLRDLVFQRHSPPLFTEH